ncbi:MAG: hypothetical protein KAX56_12245, partial [Phenylobacterium sp.]|nr:hypothetical protein [Phenylobacterium sp.]
MIARTLMLFVWGIAMTACSVDEHREVTSAEFKRPQDVLTRVCAAPSSHSGIIEAVRALGWPLLTRNQIPKQVLGNGMVTWTEVAEAPGQNFLVAVGQLDQTSFCRVYLRRTPAASVQAALERLEILDEPLGKPDFRKRIDESDVVGWHKGGRPDWRAVQVSEAVRESSNPQEMPV